MDIRKLVGARVLIRPDAASGQQGKEWHPVWGTVTATGEGSIDKGPSGPVVLVKRDDGHQGAGAGGAWVCRPTDIEPAALTEGSNVLILNHAGLPIGGRILEIAEGEGEPTYNVAANAGGIYHGRKRHGLTLAQEDAQQWLESLGCSADLPEAPSDGAPAVAQPPKNAEMGHWNFDMRVPLNHGARFPTNLPNDSDERKTYPLFSVLFGQFGAAMIDLARHSYEGNQKHNPESPLHDNRTKSNDDLDCALRHLAEGDYRGAHWRIARLHQKQLEAEGAPVAPLAVFE